MNEAKREQRTRVISSEKEFRGDVFDKLDRIEERQVQIRIEQAKLASNGKWLKAWLGAAWAAIAAGFWLILTGKEA